jgi:hypothetical protein
MENNINYEYTLPCFGKAIVDAKDIYTEYLLNVLTPLIYEGVNDLYIQAQKYETHAKEKEKKDSNFKNPGIKLFFQHLLCLFKDMSNINIEEETKRIKNGSGCAEIFDDLIRAVIKSHILVLTCTSKESKIIKEKFHETINITTFIHKCYIESIKFIHEMPELFISGEIKKNQQMANYYIKLGIKDAIKQILPMRQILEDFLNNNHEDIYESHMERIKKMLIDNIQKEKIEAEKTNLLEDSNDEVKFNSDKDRYDFDLAEFLIHKKNDNQSLPQSSEKHIDAKVKSDIKSDKPKEEVKEEIKSEVKEEVKEEIKSEVKGEIKEEIKSEAKEEVKEEVKEEAKEEVKEEVKEINKNLNPIFEKKQTINFDELFNNQKGGKKMTDNIMFDAIQALNKKKELTPLSNKDKEKNINGIDGVNIVRKIKDSDNHFYETNSTK